MKDIRNIRTDEASKHQPQFQRVGTADGIPLVRVYFNHREEERDSVMGDGTTRTVHIADFIQRKSNLTDALSVVKEEVLEQIDDYDKSPAVNGFLLNGSVEWIDIDLRIKLCTRTLPEEKKAGKTSTVLWLGNKPYELPIEAIEQIMHEIEIYAKACLDVTNSHKAKVLTLSDVSALVAYDYTAGYPEKLSFNI